VRCPGGISRDRLIGVAPRGGVGSVTPTDGGTQASRARAPRWRHTRPRTRGRPPHAHACGAAFGMRGVSGMPRVSGRAWLRGEGACGLRGGGTRSEWCGAGRCTPDPLAASRSDHVHRSMKRGSSLGARALHPGLDLDWSSRAAAWLLPSAIGIHMAMRSVLSVHRMHVRTRGRPSHAHTCGAAFGMRGVSGMPRPSCERPRNGCAGERKKEGGLPFEVHSRCTKEDLSSTSKVTGTHTSLRSGHRGAPFSLFLVLT
jgi:hypothetical protein